MAVEIVDPRLWILADELVSARAAARELSAVAYWREVVELVAALSLGERVTVDGWCVDADDGEDDLGAVD